MSRVQHTRRSPVEPLNTRNSSNIHVRFVSETLPVKTTENDTRKITILGTLPFVEASLNWEDCEDAVRALSHSWPGPASAKHQTLPETFDGPGEPGSRTRCKSHLKDGFPTNKLSFQMNATELEDSKLNSQTHHEE